ncbi:hypothetical protein NEAUS06_1592 [Nematocida ausubeli]|nr:hypothetical protein NEAUS06_1592 [Nematocida ausubeli]
MRKPKPPARAKKMNIPGKEKTCTIAVQPITEDAMEVLLRADNYQMFRKTSSNKTNEYAETITKLLEEQKALEKEEADEKKEDAFCANKIEVSEECTPKPVDAASTEEIKAVASEEKTEEKKETGNKIVTLSSWAIKLIENTSGTLEVIILGMIKDTNDIIQSSFIKKRISSHSVMSKNTTYILENACDCTVLPYAGFRESTQKKFENGFPSTWSIIIRAEVKYIQNLGKSEKSLPKPKSKKRKKWLS